MQPTNDAQLQSLWSFLFLSRLYSLGLKHVFISPGSRSTPLVQAADSLTELKKHIILDERSAAFTALGAAKASGKPTALICTSGTAVANYFPAVVEARQSGTPLLLLTADRPASERGTGSNQTINQIEIFGSYPVMFEDAGNADYSDDAFSHIGTLAEQAWLSSQEKFGPVHINFPFRKPLESDAEWLNNLARVSVKKVGNKTIVKAVTTIPDKIQNLLKNSPKVLVVAGPMRYSEDISDLKNELSTCNIPVIAEAGSQLTSLPNAIYGADAFLRNEKISQQLKPDLIIRIGRQPVSKGINKFLDHHKAVPHLIIKHNGYADNAHQGEVSATSGTLPAGFSEHLSDDNDIYLSIFKKLSSNTLYRINRSNNNVLTDWNAYQETLPILPDDWFVVASNSFPSRDLDLAGAHLISNRPVFLNRGASGIDGITSTAFGLSIGGEKSGVLFTGDLAFLHDMNALLQAEEILQTVIVIVNNNRGGQIFRMLPFTKRDEKFVTYFETPQNAHISQLAKAFKVSYKQARQPGDIARCVSSLINKKGVHIIECLTDPEASMQRRKNIWNADYS